MDDLTLRSAIYNHFAQTGLAPTVEYLTEIVGDRETAEAMLDRLHRNHMVVLDGQGEIAMALPFAAAPTDHTVANESGSWWANCAWDAFAVIAALDADARITSIWSDTGAPVDITIDGGVLSASDGFVHFAVPARRWWDDIVET